MITKLTCIYNLFLINQLNPSFYTCIANDRKENILLLNNPQFVYSLESINSIPSQKFNDFNEPFHGVKNSESDSSVSVKFDKKNKTGLNLLDPIEIKKNKLKQKQKKKTRHKTQLDHDDIFFDKAHNIKSNTDSLAISLMRPQNPNKNNKRKKKVKQDSLSMKSNVVLPKNQDKTSMIDEDFNQEVLLDNPLTVQELSDKLRMPVAEIITWLFLQGISVTINQVVDISIAKKVALHYDFTVLISSNNSRENLKNINLNQLQGIKRAPIITIFGHVDHGKTTLLDKIRQTNLAHEEMGGITQSIAGYEVLWNYEDNQEKLVFLDTPGHEAFSNMRLRGAQITDLAILVIAADDGLKPQTIESINHILLNKLPFIVAINKIDKDISNIDKVKQELAEHNIVGEDWGGDIPFIEISALTGYNINVLLSNLCILLQLYDFRADPTQLAEGKIIEAHLDKQKGAVANVLVQNGTLNVGDIVVSDNVYGRVKAIINNNGNKVSNIGPSSIAEIWGLSSLPNVGSNFYIVLNEKQAKQKALQYVDNRNSSVKVLNSRVTLESYASLSSIKQINCIVKTDTQGSIEAIINAFSQIPQEKVQLNILAASSGEISDKDIELALTSNSIILGFNVSVSSNIRNTFDKSGVLVKDFNVIYDLLEYLKAYMLNFVDPEYDKVVIGNATVQTVFSINKGLVAGCVVNSGKLKKNSCISVYRNENLVYDGMLSSLKRVKDDVNEVDAMNECGLMCNDYHLWEKLDFIEAYELNPKEKTL